MKKIFIIPLLLMLFAACNKKEVVELDFSVRTEKTSYKVGDTVKFLISGNPDQLIFYSGLVGNKFVYRDRTNAESDNITIDFATNRRFGTDAQQPQSLKLFVSQSFKGEYLEAGINETADWVDITSAFTLSGSQTADNVFVNSGVVNLLSLGNLGLTIDKTKPIYFAFKFTGNTGSTQRTWRINKFDIRLTTTDNQLIPVNNINGLGWTSVKFGTSPSNWTFGSGILQIGGGPATFLSNQAWAVSNAVYLTRVKPDIGVALKNMTSRFDQYNFIYTQPGTYKVAFEGFNINIYGESRAIKELEINVTP